MNLNNTVSNANSNNGAALIIRMMEENEMPSIFLVEETRLEEIERRKDELETR